MPIRIKFNELENHAGSAVRQYVRFRRFSTGVESKVENLSPVCAVSAVFTAFHMMKCGKLRSYTPSIHNFHRFFNTHSCVSTLCTFLIPAGLAFNFSKISAHPLPENFAARSDKGFRAVSEKSDLRKNSFNLSTAPTTTTEL